MLGLTTGVAGLLGLPFPNGLIPQAPFHTEALCVTELVKEEEEEEEEEEEDGDDDGEDPEDNDNNIDNNNDTNENDRKPASATVSPRAAHTHARITHVVEQRVSNLAQGLLTLATMTGPLLVVLHLIPQAVLAGLFFVMGVQALEGNGITAKLLFLLRDRSLPPTPFDAALLEGGIRSGAVWAFVAVELFGFGVTFAITQTVAAVGFPVCILLLIPVRAWLLPRVFSARELDALDGPTASPFTMESVEGASTEKRASADSDDRSPALFNDSTAMPSEHPSAAALRLAELGQGRMARANVSGAEEMELGSVHSRRGQPSGSVER